LLLLNQNRTFFTGNIPDIQGLAYAVLSPNQLVPIYEYSQVLKVFMDNDSPIGTTVFVPISGRNKQEEDALVKCRGRVVWPHISWAVVQASIKIASTSTEHEHIAIDFAENQRQKLETLGLGEWYACDPETKSIVNGGEPEQCWSATSFMRASEMFTEFYSS
jgi:hypothetical protein